MDDIIKNIIALQARLGIVGGQSLGDRDVAVLRRYLQWLQDEQTKRWQAEAASRNSG